MTAQWLMDPSASVNIWDLHTDQNDFGDQFSKSDLVLVCFFQGPATITFSGNDVVYYVHHFYVPGDDNLVILWRATNAVYVLVRDFCG